MSRTSKNIFWIIWLVLSLGMAGYFYNALSSIDKGDETSADIFLPNATTHGHYQIELACTACHAEPFAGKDLLQNACMNCHEKELERVEDSHPQKKFTDPRNAETLTNIDARYCVTCHVEHKPDMTLAMGVTQPDNMCFHCHANVGENRPTHKGLDFEGCASSGCHNFHDNKALYEDFLLRHRDEPVHLSSQSLEARDLMSSLYYNSDYPMAEYPVRPITREEMDKPQDVQVDEEIIDDWLKSKHVNAGVNCTACHELVDETTKELAWTDHPDHRGCMNCHKHETNSFKQGRHGMRLDVGLGPMKVEDARLEMKQESRHAELTCNSCHGAHDYDAQVAATESCLQCHDDTHSQNYESSPHAKLWKTELSGEAEAGTGVSCASCHMPRIWFEDEEENEIMLVDHNQNNTLRPNDKMLRPVCMQCHGLGFSINALADRKLIDNNFNGQPSVHVESIDMAIEVDRLHQEKMAAKKAAEQEGLAE